jgi:hypothetical protein
VYIVRPDGYVGLADPKADAGTVDAYLAAHGIGSGLRSHRGA